MTPGPFRGEVRPDSCCVRSASKPHGLYPQGLLPGRERRGSRGGGDSFSGKDSQ